MGNVVPENASHSDVDHDLGDIEALLEIAD
jgi:hypothetical protein